MAVVVTVAKGFDLGYIWKTQGQASAGRTTGGYYINAAQAGEPPGRWWARERERSVSHPGRSLSAGPMTPSTSSATRGPGPISAPPDLAVAGDPLPVLASWRGGAGCPCRGGTGRQASRSILSGSRRR